MYIKINLCFIICMRVIVYNIIGLNCVFVKFVCDYVYLYVSIYKNVFLNLINISFIRFIVDFRIFFCMNIYVYIFY